MDGRINNYPRTTDFPPLHSNNFLHIHISTKCMITLLLFFAYSLFSLSFAVESHEKVIQEIDLSAVCINPVVKKKRGKCL